MRRLFRGCRDALNAQKRTPSLLLRGRRDDLEAQKRSSYISRRKTENKRTTNSSYTRPLNLPGDRSGQTNGQTRSPK